MASDERRSKGGISSDEIIALRSGKKDEGSSACIVSLGLSQCLQKVYMLEESLHDFEQ